MLTEYLDAAMQTARFEVLENARTYGEIPAMPGVWAEAGTDAECRRELRDVAEEWTLMGYWTHARLPVIADIDPNLKMDPEANSHETSGTDPETACPGVPGSVHR